MEEHLISRLIGMLLHIQDYFDQKFHYSLDFQK